MLDYGLSTQQLAVIGALSSGVTITAAAEQAGIHRNTINYWRRNSLPFQYALSDAQYDRALFFRDKAEELVDLAIKTIHGILADAEAPASVRLRAALAILQTASTPPEPKKQVQLDVEKIVVPKTPAPTITEDQLGPAAPVEPANPPAAMNNVAQSPASTPAPGRPTPPSPASSANLPNLHKPAQTIRRENPKIGRNDPCSCGSGKKYKRCCVNTRQPFAAAA